MCRITRVSTTSIIAILYTYLPDTTCSWARPAKLECYQRRDPSLGFIEGNSVGDSCHHALHLSLLRGSEFTPRHMAMRSFTMESTASPMIAKEALDTIVATNCGYVPGADQCSPSMRRNGIGHFAQEACRLCLLIICNSESGSKLGLLWNLLNAARCRVAW